MTIVVFGSINVDLVYYAHRLPEAGETMHGDRYETELGGKGANQAVAVSALGADVALIGAVGQDAFATMALERLVALGVDTGRIRRLQGLKTGVAFIAVDARAENNITVIAGANMALGAKAIGANLELLTRTSVLLLQLETPLELGLEAADRVRAAGGRTILDPAPAPPKGLPREAYSRVHILTPNETEAWVLTGIRPTDVDGARAVATMLRGRGTETVVVKMGARGAFYMDAREEGLVPPFQVESVDSVAAGDCFNAGLAYGLAEEWSLERSVQFAAACGALATTRYGSAQTAPSLEDVQKLLFSERPLGS